MDFAKISMNRLLIDFYNTFLIFILDNNVFRIKHDTHTFEKYIDGTNTVGKLNYLPNIK